LTNSVTHHMEIIWDYWRLELLIITSVSECCMHTAKKQTRDHEICGLAVKYALWPLTQFPATKFHLQIMFVILIPPLRLCWSCNLFAVFNILGLIEAVFLIVLILITIGVPHLIWNGRIIFVEESPPSLDICGSYKCVLLVECV